MRRIFAIIANLFKPKMKNFLLPLLAILFCTISSCAQNTSKYQLNSFSVDPAIRSEAQKHFSSNENLPKEKMGMQMYDNEMQVQLYDNDVLRISSKDSSNLPKTLFKSFYYWQHDTLCIDGAFGMFTGVGFSLKIKGNEAKVYHMLASDENPGYALHENDSLTFRIEVPCTDTKTVLSEIPDSVKKPIIYGYVEFSSDNYYYPSGGIADGKELSPRTKARTKMKIYFKSGKLDM